MRCLIISDTTTHLKYWYYKYVQLLRGRKHTFAPPLFILGWAPPLLAPPPLSTPLNVLARSGHIKYTQYRKQIHFATDLLIMVPSKLKNSLHYQPFTTLPQRAIAINWNIAYIMHLIVYYYLSVIMNKPD